jgi:enoyl-CoA hydratase
VLVRLPRLVGMGRALDLILTGRAVGAEEAHEIGLATKVVPRSCSRASAEQLAREIARFPQACMLVDPASAWRQWDLPMREALVQETRSADLVRNAGAFEGAERFRFRQGSTWRFRIDLGTFGARSRTNSP